MDLFSKLPKDKILLNESLNKHTSFKIGGPADLMFVPTTTEELVMCVQICENSNTPYYILGRGSNVLFSDKGFRGVVIKTTALKNIEKQNETIYASAGVNLSAFANFLLKEALSGFEFASGIPGNIGGALYMNAGAYGEEIKDVVVSVDVYKDGRVQNIPVEEMAFDYRYSLAQKEPMIILGGYFKFVDGIAAEIKEKTQRLNKMRIDKQPLDLPNAGSTFRKPEHHFAGKLIQDANLMGYRIGDAEVSTKHAGFIVNTGAATAQNVLDLVAHIKEVIYQKDAVILVEELKIIGER